MHNKYISNKIRKLYELEVSEYDDLYTFLYCALNKKGYKPLNSEDLYPWVEYQSNPLKVTDNLTWYKIKVCQKYDIPTKQGLYVHMLNKDMDIKNPNSYKDLSRLDKPVCVSNISDMQYSNRSTKIGIIFSGIPEKTFPFDCWSITDKDGNRIATRDHYDDFININRYESWLIPNKCKLVGLVYNQKSKKIVENVINSIDVNYILDYNIINKI